MTDLIEPWTRQANESAQAFAAFAVYRDQGADRSTRAVAARVAKSEQLMRRWSSAHAWVARAAAWDREQDRLARVQAERERVAMNRRHAQGAVALQGKAIERLREIPSADISARDLVHMFDVAAKVERAARGEPDRHEHSGPGGAPIPVAATAAVILDPATVQEILRDQQQLETERMVRLAEARAAGGLAPDDDE